MRKILLDTNLSSVALNQGKVINPEKTTDQLKSKIYKKLISLVTKLW